MSLERPKEGAMMKLSKMLLALVVWFLFLNWLMPFSRLTEASSVNTTVIYNASGVEQAGEHIVMGTATLAAGTAAVTFTGKAVFTSNSSFICTATDATGLNLTQIVRNSGSSITVNGVLTDVVQFFCVGN
jgi:hypothetical protein